MIFAYPYQLEAYRGDKWQGVVPSPSDYEGYDGAAFYNYMNVDAYRFVEPATATAATADAGADRTLLIVVGIVAAVIVVGLIVWMTARRRGRTVEE